MYGIKIKAITLADSANGKGIFDPEENVKQEDITEATEVRIGILEAGMQSKKTSVMIAFKMPDGKVKIGQMSAEMFEAIAGAVRGSVQNWGK